MTDTQKYFAELSRWVEKDELTRTEATRLMICAYKVMYAKDADAEMKEIAELSLEIVK